MPFWCQNMVFVGNGQKGENRPFWGPNQGALGCHLAKTARNHGIFGSGNLGASQGPSGPPYRVRTSENTLFWVSHGKWIFGL